MPKTSLGINIIARNGEHDLSELLPIIHDTADEIVIALDHRTDDGTKAICSGFSKVKVIDYDWGDKGFCGARNAAIDGTKSNYIAWFDCDDRPTSMAPLATFKKTNDNLKTIYTFQIRNVPGASVFNQVRMFPNAPEVRFVYRIHETISHETVNHGYGIAPFSLIVDHHGYKHKSNYADKLSRNLPLIEAEIKTGSFCPTLRYTYAMNLLSLGYHEQAEHWLRTNIIDEVKNSPFRDVYLFSILNVSKLLINKKAFSEADHYLVKGLLALPDFKEFHVLRAHVYYHTGDFLTAGLSLKNASHSPQRDYAISTEWDQVNGQIKNLSKLLNTAII